MYNLSIIQRLQRRKKNKSALEGWRIQIYTDNDLHCVGNKINKSPKRIHLSNYAPTRQLKRKQD